VRNLKDLSETWGKLTADKAICRDQKWFASLSLQLPETSKSMIRTITLLTISIFFIFCAPVKNAKNAECMVAGTIKLHEYQVISAEGKKSLYAMLDTFAALSGVPVLELDTSFLFKAFMEKPSDWLIEFTPDTIWRIKNSKGKKLERTLVDRKSRTVTNFTNDLVPRVISVDTIPSIEEKGNIHIVEYKKERKEILGFDCYKVIWERREEKNYDIPFDFGNTVVELYVTDKINLPPFALFDLPKELPYFPLEIRYYMNNLCGMDFYYEVKEITRKKINGKQCKKP
jgi:hypothetical protein